MAGKVVIGGGSGFIGTLLVDILKKKGYEPIIVSRKSGDNAISWDDLEKTGLPQNTTVVVNLAGENMFDGKSKWTEEFKERAVASRVKTTAALAEAISKAADKPNVFVSIAGVGFYPASETVDYDEDFSKSGDDFLGRFCQAWEDAVLVDGKPPIRSVIIRTGPVLAKNAAMVKSLWLPYYLGLGGPVSPGTQFMPWIHVDDLVRLMVHSIENQNVSGVLNGVAPQVVTNREFSKALAGAMWRPSFVTVPAFVLRWAMGEDRAKMMSEGRKVIPKRTLASGFTYIFTSINEACAAVV